MAGAIFETSRVHMKIVKTFCNFGVGCLVDVAVFAGSLSFQALFVKEVSQKHFVVEFHSSFWKKAWQKTG